MWAASNTGKSSSTGALAVCAWKRFLLVAMVVKIRDGGAESGLRSLRSGRLGHFVDLGVSN